MKKENDFYNGDAENVFNSWYNGNSKSPSRTAKFLDEVFNNEAGRSNSYNALKWMAEEIVSINQNYKDILVFEKDMSETFKSLDSVLNGNKIKQYLTELKLNDTINSFKKHGLNDLEELKNGKISKVKLNDMLEAIFIIQKNITKDPEATVIFNKMMEVTAFKSEYELVSKKQENINYIKNKIKNNNFIEAMEDICRFHKVKSFEEIPIGNDKLSIHYRKEIMPILDKMSKILEDLNLSANLNDGEYSKKFTEEEIEKLDRLRNSFNNYEYNKKEFYKINNYIDPSINKSNNSNDFTEFNKLLENAENVYVKITETKNPRYDEKSKLKDLIKLKEMILTMPEIKDDSEENLRFQILKRNVEYNDIILKNDFNNANKNIENLKNENLIEKFKSGNLTSNIDKSSFINNMKEISKAVNKIFEKYGLKGLPSFNENEQLKFIEMNALNDRFKKKKQENTNELKQKI